MRSVTMLEPITIGGFVDGLLQISPSPYVPVEGEVYQVSWDGVEHTCVCFSRDGFLVISDAVFDESGQPITATFFIQYASAEFLESEDDMVVLAAVDMSSDSMFDTVNTEHTVAVCHIPTEAILEDFTFTSALDYEFGFCYGIMSEVGLLEIDKQYVVVWDGTAHLCTAKDAGDTMPGTVFLGNGEPFMLSGNNEPFIVGLTAEGLLVFVCLTDMAENDHKVSLYLVAESSSDVGLSAIVLKKYDGTDVSYQEVKVVKFNTPSGELQSFTRGEAVSKTVEQLDFSAGNMDVPIEEGELVTEMTITKPLELTPDNIRKGKEIAGVVGEFIGDTEEVEVDLNFAENENHIVEPSAQGKVMSKVTINKPANLVPAYIAKDIEIAGVIGELTGGGDSDFNFSDPNLQFFSYNIDTENKQILLYSILYNVIYEVTGSYDVNIPDKIGGYDVVIVCT